MYNTHPAGVPYVHDSLIQILYTKQNLISVQALTRMSLASFYGQNAASYLGLLCLLRGIPSKLYMKNLKSLLMPLQLQCTHPNDNDGQVHSSLMGQYSI